MSSRTHIFTSESVSEGHPDKVSDQISDAILDAHLKGDKFSRVACETMTKNNMVILGGEITSNEKVNYEALVRDTIREIGYTDEAIGFEANSCEIIEHISAQSNDISMGVTEGEGDYKEQGAGDQGLMFGFACNETEEYMPLPIALSHEIVYKLAEARKASVVPFLRPDSKSQVSVRYSNGKPEAVTAVVVSTQHTEGVKQSDIEEFVREQIIKEVVPGNLLSNETKYYVNPTGNFVIGGPVGDCGLTGRKIIVDTYGGYSRHGGGAFSGKDPSKVDRSAAYACRYIAKNVVAAGLADKAEVQVAYAIGVAEPVSIYVDTFGTAKVDEQKIEARVGEVFNLTPKGIIEGLDLLKPIYQKTAAYGHFGRKAEADGAFSWERLDKVDELKRLL